MKIQADLPENINKALKVHQLRYSFKYLSDAMIDVLKRFFANEDYDYFLMKNEDKEVLKSDPDFIKALNKEEKVRKSQKRGSCTIKMKKEEICENCGKTKEMHWGYNLSCEKYKFNEKFKPRKKEKTESEKAGGR